MEERRLDIISDVMALTGYRNSRNVVIIAAELAGPFREEIFRSAVREASVKFPAMTSVLKEVRSRGRFFFVRELAAVAEAPIFVSELDDSVRDQLAVDTLMDRLTPRLDRHWNLFREPPVEIHVFRSAGDRVSAVFLFHHSSSDGAMALRLVTEVFGQYEKILTAAESKWLEIPYVFSTSKKRPSNPKTSWWKDLISQSLRDLSYRKNPPVKPSGNGDPKDLREWHVRELLSAEDTSEIMNNFSAGGSHVVDHMVACANLALEEWNTTRNTPVDNITSVVTINMRRRFGGDDERNYSSALFFRTSPSDRTGYTDFVARLAESRERQLQKRADLTLRKSFSLGSKFFSIFPMGIRRRAAYAVMLHQNFSIAVGFLGNLWPEYGPDGKTSTSSVRKVGDLEILDIFGSGYKLAGNAYINIYAYVYAGRLNLILTVSAALLDKGECREFLKLIVNRMKSVAGMSTDSDCGA